MDGAGHTYYAQYVILATGMMDEQPHIQGSIRPILPYANGQTVAYCLVCDGHRSLGKKTVVIGYSEDAASAAIILANKYRLKDVTVLTNGQKPQFTEGNRRFKRCWVIRKQNSYPDLNWKMEQRLRLRSALCCLGSGQITS